MPTIASLQGAPASVLRRLALACLLPLAALVAAPPATAASFTLHVDGQFSGLMSYLNRNNPVYLELGRLANGSASWGDVYDTLALELDFDDTLTVTPFNETQSYYSYGTLHALRLRLGNLSFSSSSLAAGSKIDFGLRDSVPDLAAGAGFSLALLQTRSRDASGAYTFVDATPVLSGDGRYSYYFNASSDLGAGPRLEIWTLKSADHKLAGGNPVAAWSTTGVRVTPLVSAVPEAGSGALLLAGLAMLGLLARRRRCA